MAGERLDVLIAAARESDNDRSASPQAPCCLGKIADGMGRLERWQNAFGARQQLRALQCAPVADRDIPSSLHKLIVRMLRADAWIIKAGGNGFGRQHLAETILQEQAVGAMQHTGASFHQRGGMVAWGQRAAAGFNTNHLHAPIMPEWMKQADGV